MMTSQQQEEQAKEKPMIVPTEQKRKRGRPKKVKQRSRAKRPRMTCPICFKPNAVRYTNYDKKKDGTISRSLIYEHRDEPPVSDYLYTRKDRERTQRHLRYRRCSAGIVKTADLPVLGEPEPESEAAPEPQVQEQQQQKVLLQIPNGEDFEKKYNDLILRHTTLLEQYEKSRGLYEALRKRHLRTIRYLRMAIEADDDKD